MTAADPTSAALGPGRVPPAAARTRQPRLRIIVTCLGACNTDLATGTTDDPPTNRRYETRWAELDALANRHTAETGHPTRQGAGPEVAR